MEGNLFSSILYHSTALNSWNLKTVNTTYWADFLAGVGKLTSQTEIKHIAASAGTCKSSHCKVRLQLWQERDK